MFKRITIIGLGLIGGSLGLSIKRHRFAREVVGVSRRRKTLTRALKIGAVDRVTLNSTEGIKDADLIILATPILKIIDIFKRIKENLKEGCIVIDVGSTKNFVSRKIEKEIPECVSYVGCHPMAGSEKKGIDFARSDLFKGNYCILTRTRDTQREALLKIRKFWEGLGMKVVIISPEKHDRIISSLSHLPHAVSVALINSLNNLELKLSSGGLRDTTRIAASDPELWRDIFLTNRKNILREIGNFEKSLKILKNLLKKSDKAGLFKFFHRAKVIRETISV